MASHERGWFLHSDPTKCLAFNVQPHGHTWSLVLVFCSPSSDSCSRAAGSSVLPPGWCWHSAQPAGSGCHVPPKTSCRERRALTQHRLFRVSPVMQEGEPLQTRSVHLEFVKSTLNTVRLCKDHLSSSFWGEGSFTVLATSNGTHTNI